MDKHNSDEKKMSDNERPSLETELGHLAERIKTVVGTESMRSFARKCSISDTVLRQYVAGKSDPTRGRLVEIARTAGVNLEWLATGEGPMRPGESVTTSIGGKIDVELLIEIAGKLDGIFGPSSIHGSTEDGLISTDGLVSLTARIYDNVSGINDILIQSREIRREINHLEILVFGKIDIDDWAAASAEDKAALRIDFPDMLPDRIAKLTHDQAQLFNYIEEYTLISWEYSILNHFRSFVSGHFGFDVKDRALTDDCEPDSYKVYRWQSISTLRLEFVLKKLVSLDNKELGFADSANISQCIEELKGNIKGTYDRLIRSECEPIFHDTFMRRVDAPSTLLKNAEMTPDLYDFTIRMFVNGLAVIDKYYDSKLSRIKSLQDAKTPSSPFDPIEVKEQLQKLLRDTFTQMREFKRVEFKRD